MNKKTVNNIYTEQHLLSNVQKHVSAYLLRHNDAHVKIHQQPFHTTPPLMKMTEISVLQI